MTVYEYLKNQKYKLIEAHRNSGAEWIAKKIHEIQAKIDSLSIEEAGRGYRPASR